MRYARDVTKYLVRYYDPENETTCETEFEDFTVKSPKMFSNFVEREYGYNVLKCDILERSKRIYEIDDSVLLEHSELIEEEKRIF